jgi:hypothetical protein
MNLEFAAVLTDNNLPYQEALTTATGLVLERKLPGARFKCRDKNGEFKLVNRNVYNIAANHKRILSVAVPNSNVFLMI